MSPLSKRQSGLCSTPCGINGKTTGQNRNKIESACRCSTPCGINGKTTNDPANARKHDDKKCSTPCGINGKTTPDSRSSMNVLPRAQRLAASTEKPRSAHHNMKILHHVLNALRHQRKNHPERRRWPKAFGCAQRLAASTEKPQFARRAPGPLCECSTPCGINGKTTRKPRPHRG